MSYFLPFHDNKTLQRVGTFDLSHACMLCAAHKQKIQLNLEFQFVCATCQNCVGCMHAQSELICRVPDPLPFAGFFLKRRKYIVGQFRIAAILRSWKAKKVNQMLKSFQCRNY